jgi:hypothetical protein
MEYLTLNQAGNRGPIPAYRLRLMQKQGTLPGFFSGNRFYVNYTLLLEQIDRECKAAMGNRKESVL